MKSFQALLGGILIAASTSFSARADLNTNAAWGRFIRGTSSYAPVLLPSSFQWSSARFNSYGPRVGYETPFLASGVPLIQTLGWQGQRRDVTGLYYSSARPYDSIERRFLTVDPVGIGSLIPYSYCNGDPVYCFDPDGQAPQTYNANNPATWQLGTLNGKGYWSGTAGQSPFIFRSDTPEFRLFGGQLNYVSGVPDFRPWQVNPTINGVNVSGGVTIEVSGNQGTDRARAISAMSEQSGLPRAEVEAAVEGLEFHHFQGNELTLVPTEINQGVYHSGPASAARAAAAAAEEASFLERAGGAVGTGLKALGILALLDVVANPGDALGGIVAGPVTTMGDATVTGAAERMLGTSTDPYQRLQAYMTLQGWNTLSQADARELVNLQMNYDLPGQQPAPASMFQQWNQGVTLSKKPH